VRRPVGKAQKTAKNNAFTMQGVWRAVLHSKDPMNVRGTETRLKRSKSTGFGRWGHCGRVSQEPAGTERGAGGMGEPGGGTCLGDG